MGRECNPELKELVPHRTGELPMRVYHTGDVYYHWHEEYEFLLLEEGTAQCVINGRHITMKPGMMAMVPGGVLHMYRVDTPQVMTAVVVHPCLWENGSQGSLFDGKLAFQQLFSMDNPEESPLIEAVLDVVSLYQARPFGYGFRIGAVLSGIFARMLAQGMYTQGGPRPPRDAIAPMLAYVHQQYAQPLSLVELMAEFHYSKSYIIQLFRKKTGMTPVQYIKRYRLEKARRALAEEEDSVLGISLRCGFSNVGYFIRSFKSHTGMTPGSYRRTLRKKNHPKNLSDAP